jgi:hypothetical protein
MERFTDQRPHNVGDGGDVQVDLPRGSADVEQDSAYVLRLDVFQNVGTEAVVEMLPYWSREIVLKESKPLSESASYLWVKGVSSKIETNNG